MNLLKITVVAVLAGAVLFASPNRYKRYDIKSGKIDYKVINYGNIMGVETKVIGIKRVLFDSYGAKELSEENRVQKTIIDGKISTDKSHKMTFMNGAIIYNIDMNKKRIVRMQNPALLLSSLKGRSPMKYAEDIMKKMGGKKTGSEKVLGYRCEVWKVMDVKQCIYKGVPLKIESRAMGMHSTEIATKVKFDIALKEKNFKLPDFPVYNETGEKLDRSKLKEMDRYEVSNEADVQ